MFCRQVVACKRRILQLVGDQCYLKHAPHLTLYASCFSPETDLLTPVREVAGRLEVPTVDIRDWHVFEGDRLTGGNTLACDVPVAARDSFRKIQQEMVAALAPLRDPEASRSHYESAWDGLSREERVGVKGFGFPFVGRLWRPHVTIASIVPSAWQTVWSALADTPLKALVGFPCLTLQVVEQVQSVPVERFALQRPEG